MDSTPTLSCPYCGGSVTADARKCPHCGAADKPGWRADVAGYEGIDVPAERTPEADTGFPVTPPPRPRWSRDYAMKVTAVVMLVLFIILSLVGALFNY